MPEKYYSFQDSYVFNQDGKSCYAFEIKPFQHHLSVQTNGRGDGVRFGLEVELMTGKIHMMKYSFRETYISTAEIQSTPGTVLDLKEVSKEQALEILIENKPSIDLAIQRLRPKDSISQ